MVAVIGGGPAGATCAFYLAKMGVPTTLYEARPNDRKPCAGGLNSAIFDRFGDLVRGLKKRSNPIYEAELALDEMRSSFSFDKPPGYVIDRMIFDSALRRRAKLAGCKLVHSSKDPSESDDAMVVDARGAYHSGNNAILVSSICRMKKSPLKIEFLSKYNKLGYFWVFPLSDRLVNIGVGEFDRAAARKIGAGFEEYVEMNGAKVLWKRYWQESVEIPKVVIRNVGGRTIVAAGERAGFVNPLTGEGIFPAMESGRKLANCIVEGDMDGYSGYVGRMRFKFNVYKMIRDLVLLPKIKPRLGLAGAWAFVNLIVKRGVVV